MNYIKIYNKLISGKAARRKGKDVYYESHHIMPKSLGGGNEKSNLVLLTSREHFVAHRLLTKIYPTSWEMKFALFMMAQEDTKAAMGLSVNSNTYEKLRIDVVEARQQFAFIHGSIEFDNKIKFTRRVTSKLRSKWRWSKKTKDAIALIICNGIPAYEQSVAVCYRRSTTAYSSKTGRCSSKSILKALDLLVELGYVEDERSDSDVPISKRRLSIYRLTEDGYTRFTGLGEKI